MGRNPNATKDFLFYRSAHVIPLYYAVSVKTGKYCIGFDNTPIWVNGSQNHDLLKDYIPRLISSKEITLIEERECPLAVRCPPQGF